MQSKAKQSTAKQSKDCDYDYENKDAAHAPTYTALASASHGAKQSKAKQSRGKAKQSKAQKSKAKQSKVKQSKARSMTRAAFR